METSDVRITWTLALLCTLAGGAWAGCCFPKQFSANQAIMRSTVNGGSLSIKLTMNVYWYCAINQMEAFDQTVIVDGQLTKMKIIKDYNITKTKYEIAADGTCSKTPLDAFKEECIPDNQTAIISSKIGLSTSGIPVEMFNNGAGNTTSYLTIVPEGCYPMVEVSARPTGPSPYTQFLQFHNFTLGIQDPSVFTIPGNCTATVITGK